MHEWYSFFSLHLEIVTVDRVFDHGVLWAEDLVAPLEPILRNNDISGPIYKLNAESVICVRPDLVCVDEGYWVVEMHVLRVICGFVASNRLTVLIVEVHFCNRAMASVESSRRGERSTEIESSSVWHTEGLKAEVLAPAELWHRDHFWIAVMVVLYDLLIVQRIKVLFVSLNSLLNWVQLVEHGCQQIVLCDSQLLQLLSKGLSSRDGGETSNGNKFVHCIC